MNLFLIPGLCQTPAFLSLISPEMNQLQYQRFSSRIFRTPRLKHLNPQYPGRLHKLVTTPHRCLHFLNMILLPDKPKSRTTSLMNPPLLYLLSNLFRIRCHPIRKGL